MNANAYHGPILHFKKNMLSKWFAPSPLLSSLDFKRAALDYVVTGNAYLQKWEQSVQRAREAKRKADRSDRYNRVRDVYFGTDTPRWDEKGIYYEW
jgi:capsid portal protein